MDLDLTQLQNLVKLFGLDAALFASAIGLSLGLRFARAYVKWVDDPHTLFVAVGLGLVGSGLVLTLEHRPWQFIVLQGLLLTVAVLLCERVLRSQAGKYGLPFDNEWVDDATNKPNGGTK